MAIPFGSPTCTITAAAIAPIPRIAQISSSICKAAATNKWTTALNHLVTDNSNSSATFLEYYNNNIDGLSIKHTEKIMDVRHMLEAEEEAKEPLKCMVMIDALQRLGIDYHFQEQIQDQLLSLHVTTGLQNSIYESQDLDQVSLYFRLLRQEGFYVNVADMFNNFKNKEGEFIVKKTATKGTIRSLMELYEASQLRIEGEYILDEAENISSQLLRKWVVTNVVDENKAVIIANTLSHPYRKSLARFETVNLFRSKFITGNNININCNSWENTLLELSIMDSFISRDVYRTDLRKISKWWNEVELTKELKLARDQPLKWFAWPMGILPDLSLSEERIELAKSVSLIYIIDDIFDLYGTLEELTLFTDAVNRWELDAVEKLPDYMKMSFRVLYDITNETCQMIAKKHGSINLPDASLSLRKAWASLCNAYLVEAKWLASKETPKTEEYLKNGIVTSGVHVTLVHLFFLLGLGSSSEQNAKMLQDISGIISSVATILRLWNDLGSSKDDGQHGHDYSYINYYMKEHEGVSVELSREHVIQRISDEWKRLNKECLSRNQSSASFQKGAVNLARMVPLMYDYDHHSSLPSLGEYMRSMFSDAKAGTCKQTQICDDPFHLLG